MCASLFPYHPTDAERTTRTFLKSRQTGFPSGGSGADRLRAPTTAERLTDYGGLSRNLAWARVFNNRKIFFSLRDARLFQTSELKCTAVMRSSTTRKWSNFAVFRKPSNYESSSRENRPLARFCSNQCIILYHWIGFG